MSGWRVGIFDFWDKDSALVYRNTLSLAGGANLRTEQAMALLASALDAAERGYPACQYVVWAGKITRRRAEFSAA